MKGLRCITRNCEHNVNMRCMAGIISVGNSGKCKTKIKREGGILAQSFNDYEVGKEEDVIEVDNLVSCNAACVYNHEGQCVREHLLIEDRLLATKCASRIKND